MGSLSLSLSLSHFSPLSPLSHVSFSYLSLSLSLSHFCCSSGYLGTSSVDQATLKLTEIHLHLPLSP